MEADKRRIAERFREGILEVQQKAGFKNQLLEHKLSLIQNELETKETQLSEVLASTNLDPASLDTVTRRMEVSNCTMPRLRPVAVSPGCWFMGGTLWIFLNRSLSVCMSLITPSKTLLCRYK